MKWNRPNIKEKVRSEEARTGVTMNGESSHAERFRVANNQPLSVRMHVRVLIVEMRTGVKSMKQTEEPAHVGINWNVETRKAYSNARWRLQLLASAQT
jgi:hypothetical protein